MRNKHPIILKNLFQTRQNSIGRKHGMERETKYTENKIFKNIFAI